jgi:catalase
VAAWKAYVQIMPLEDADTYRYDPFDVTKVWRYRDYPLIPIGRLVLDRNPENFFAEIEQAAFSPANFVPGVEPSPDKLLQGRLFSYPDTQRHRLGPNFAQIPVNCPHARRANHQRDGLMRVDGNGGASANYSPSSRGGPTATPSATEVPVQLSGSTGRSEYPWAERAGDFEQAGLLFRVLDPEARARLVANIADHLGQARRDVQRRQLRHFLEADPEYGARVGERLRITAE